MVRPSAFSAAQRPSTAVCGEGATQNSRSAKPWAGKSVLYFACVVALVGFRDCVHRQDALGCHGLSSYLAARYLPLYVCEVEKNKCSRLEHQIVQSSAHSTAWHRAPLGRFFCVCRPSMLLTWELFGSRDVVAHPFVFNCNGQSLPPAIPKSAEEYSHSLRPSPIHI